MLLLISKKSKECVSKWNVQIMFDVYTIKYMLPDVDKKIARKYISLDRTWSKNVATRNLSAPGEKYIND